MWTPTTAPAAEGVPETVVHIVEKGDNLSAIALRYEVDVESIAKSNDIATDSVLSIGQALVIANAHPEEMTPTPTATATPTPTATAMPTPTAAASLPPTSTSAPEAGANSLTHIVAQGDNLGAIALKYDVDIESITQASQISVGSVLRVGQELVIPGLAPTLTPTSTPSRAPSPTPTCTVVVSPTQVVSPTLTFPYPQPHLLSPTNGSAVEGCGASLVLNWTSVGILGQDEWYLLRLWTPEDPNSPEEIWTKTPSWRVPLSHYPRGRRLRRFSWQVTLVSRIGEGQQWAPASPSSEKYIFIWQ